MTTGPPTMSTSEAAQILGVSLPTVRTRIADGTLTGRKESVGSRFRWRIPRSEVEALASTTLDRPRAGRARQGATAALRAEIAELRAEIAELRAEIAELRTKPPAVAAASLGSPPVLADESVRDVVLQQRAIVDAVLSADDARAEVVRLLTQALAASETADEHRRRAQRAADALTAQFLI